MPIKFPTKWDIAKPLLERDYLLGNVTDTMRRAEVHGHRDEYKAVPINNFGNNWNRMKKKIKDLKRDSDRDQIAFDHDRKLHPVDPDRWDGSEAQAHLKDDMNEEFWQFLLTVGLLDYWIVGLLDFLTFR